MANETQQNNKGRLYQAFCNAGLEREARTLSTIEKGTRKTGLGRKILIYDSWRFGGADKFNGYQAVCQISDLIKTRFEDIREKINPGIDNPQDILNYFINKYCPTIN